MSEPVAILLKATACAAVLLVALSLAWAQPEFEQGLSNLGWREWDRSPGLRDLALRGPVATQTFRQYTVIPTRDPAIQPAGLVVSSRGSMVGEAYHHVFDHEGRLVRFEMHLEGGWLFWAYDYMYIDGVYAGYEGWLFPRGTTRSQSEGSMYIEWLSPTVESVVYRGYRGSGAGLWLRTYDDAGQLLEHRYMDEDGAIRSWRTYAYLSGALVEVGWAWPDGRREVEHSYDVTFATVAGEPRPVLLVHQGREGSNQYTIERTYYPDGTLATERLVRPGSAETNPDAGYSARYDPAGRLIEDGARQIMYFWEGDSLVRSDTYHFDLRLQVLNLRRCLFLNHDLYGNWTERRCTRSVPVGEIDAQWEPFTGGLAIREFTYHRP